MPQSCFATKDPSNDIVAELIEVLTPHPRGLRRWSVMNAIRQRRPAASRDIPLKMEADIERVFRQYCTCDKLQASGTPLFCRPGENAGEVWALAAPSARNAGPAVTAAAQ